MAAESVPENLPEVWNPPPGVQRAALAFSAMPTRAALNISSRLTLVERSQLREGLSRIHEIGEQERREAVDALVRAVHAGVGFPSPAAHDEAKCPFRRVESTPAAEVASVLGSSRAHAAVDRGDRVVSSPRASYRSEVWGQLGSAERAAIRPTLSQIPTLSPTRTAMYALDLRDRIAHRR